ncbi:MAG TPA: hydroxyethylthiazole kinase [Candidatus Omnitrophota bacterium]|nr:hydroxyethylthiazole kinase [Candidatus Omnitrophota bacterium]HPS19817.1 hydroxyethylthiazole kinase [Candidatus Omnitrophota bacterium]
MYPLLKNLRERSPLVHHITNWVTIYDCANVVKILGASPVMAHAKEESADMAAISSALVLNIGTLTTEIIDSMISAARSANKKGIPVVLDVCGAGATEFRNKKCMELIKKVKIDIIKGNSSEIAKIAGENVKTKGVDAGTVEKDLIKIANKLAKNKKCVVVITGKEDISTDGTATYIVKNGHKMMSHVVGTGCMASSAIGAFAAIEKDLAKAAAAALSTFGIAGEIAAKKCSGPASFKSELFDAIYNLNKKTCEKMQKIKKLQ